MLRPTGARAMDFGERREEVDSLVRQPRGKRRELLRGSAGRRLRCRGRNDCRAWRSRGRRCWCSRCSDWSHGGLNVASCCRRLRCHGRRRCGAASDQRYCHRNHGKGNGYGLLDVVQKGCSLPLKWLLPPLSQQRLTGIGMFQMCHDVCRGTPDLTPTI